MPHVAALYRYPVKGFTPESRESVTITADGRIAGDRVLGFRFADTPEPDDAWSSKFGMLVLVNTPGLARLRLEYDDAAGRLKITCEGATLTDESLDAEGRRRISEAVAAYAVELSESPLAGHLERMPLRLVGDGVTPRLQDRPDGYVTMHGRESITALSKALDTELSELRFRSNVAIEGLEPFEEQEWMGKTLRIGSIPFRVQMPIRRCLATHANPQTGERDQPVLTTLTHTFGQEQPTLAVALVPLAAGEVHLGDDLTVEG
ncbi:MAG TPA: MOSC N-terminal beta barrel domain-containing protein [Dehalococcoidia bacterium]|nr:MOSC N-terminal beta barrel domain-containing protein [Dehalococcoidia bacterium]